MGTKVTKIGGFQSNKLTKNISAAETSSGKTIILRLLDYYVEKASLTV
jgi:hypothetical protein